jgi:solute carrier family 25 aspartate/glutamate transporter 12/13
MKGLQGERLRQAFKYLDKDQDGFILPEQFKQIILVRDATLDYDVLAYTSLKEIAGHKLSDAVIDRLPTLCTLSPGQRISYSEVIAFHNVIRGEDTYLSGATSLTLRRNGHDRTVSKSLCLSWSLAY